MNSLEMHNMRLADIGDWEISDTPNSVFFDIFCGRTRVTDYDFLILMHEITEAYLCYRQGVTGEEVDKYDMEHEHCDSPGDHEDAPYHKQHMIATDVESMLSVALGVNWMEYEQKQAQIMKKSKRKEEK